MYFRVSRLKEQCDGVHVRKLMMKYGLKNVQVPEGADAEVNTTYSRHLSNKALDKSAFCVCSLEVEVNIVSRSLWHWHGYNSFLDA